MNKQQYQVARRLMRDNGKYATQWMDLRTAHTMLNIEQQADDKLQMRNRWGRYEPTKMRLKLWPVRTWGCSNLKGI